MKIIIASDHAGFKLKEYIKNRLISQNHEVKDIGCFTDDPVDYPKYAFEVARRVANGEFERGILFCGSGLGMCIAANRIIGIRATVCYDSITARLSREHNDCNILCLGGRLIDEKRAEEIVDVWLNTPFAGGRHENRIKQIDAEASR